ncbi:NKAP family protein-like [Schistocerca gregaria]|uniref:NKAP family protein-like n=1 Tax=Schistocerca gregaria TaxID=7010 RepID=UPI00211F2370|nr:NKAP family protein-like [Schistocerca gregaria]
MGERPDSLGYRGESSAGSGFGERVAAGRGDGGAEGGGGFVVGDEFLSYKEDDRMNRRGEQRQFGESREYFLEESRRGRRREDRSPDRRWSRSTDGSHFREDDRRVADGARYREDAPYGGSRYRDRHDRPRSPDRREARDRTRSPRLHRDGDRSQDSRYSHGEPLRRRDADSFSEDFEKRERTSLFSACAEEYLERLEKGEMVYGELRDDSAQEVLIGSVYHTWNPEKIHRLRRYLAQRQNAPAVNIWAASPPRPEYGESLHSSEKKKHSHREKHVRRSERREEVVPHHLMDESKREEYELMQELKVKKMKVSQDQSDSVVEEEDMIGPMPLRQIGLSKGYEKAMLPGEADAYASFVQENKRIPRRGEIGLTADQIAQYEELGYQMSGGRHRRMNAVRIRKESQIYSHEEQRLLEKLNMEERNKRENRVMADLSRSLYEKVKSHRPES